MDTRWTRYTINTDSGYRTWRLKDNVHRYYEPAGSASTHGWTDDKHDDDNESFFNAVDY